MSRFDDRWRALARAARRKPEPAPAPLREEWLVRLAAAARARDAGRETVRRRWARDWALPAAAVLLLYALAFPAFGPAWTSVEASLGSARLVLPRPPSVPPPPVPSPPPLPRAPVDPAASELLKDLWKEMQP